MDAVRAAYTNQTRLLYIGDGLVGKEDEVDADLVSRDVRVHDVALELEVGRHTRALLLSCPVLSLPSLPLRSSPLPSSNLTRVNLLYATLLYRALLYSTQRRTNCNKQYALLYARCCGCTQLRRPCAMTAAAT